MLLPYFGIIKNFIESVRRKLIESERRSEMRDERYASIFCNVYPRVNIVVTASSRGKTADSVSLFLIIVWALSRHERTYVCASDYRTNIHSLVAYYDNIIQKVKTHTHTHVVSEKVSFAHS